LSFGAGFTQGGHLPAADACRNISHCSIFCTALSRSASCLPGDTAKCTHQSATEADTAAGLMPCVIRPTHVFNGKSSAG
jgi:hypothetical protein